MSIDKEFALKSGDIVTLDKTPFPPYYVKVHVTWGYRLVQLSDGEETLLFNRDLTPGQWIKELDARFTRQGWTLHRRIGSVEWIALPRPSDV